MTSAKSLLQAIPDQYRRWIYAAYVAIGVLIGATQVGIATAGADQPTALTVTLAVYGYLGVALGLVAEANTPKDDDLDYEDDPLL